MSFTDHKITQFTHRIVDLPDQPNLPADELKARFDSSPEELRQAVNGICDDATTLSGKVDSILAETFDGVVEKSMLSEALAEELDAKAVETSVASRFTAEQTAREAADSALSTRVSTAESTITTHTSQIAQKCQIYYGTYTGDGAASKTITLGFRPKAVFVLQEGTLMMISNRVFGSLALSSRSAVRLGVTTMSITSNGFTVYQNSSEDVYMNDSNSDYLYIAFR